MAPSNDKSDENLFDDEDGNNIVKIKEETEKASPHIVASILNINDTFPSGREGDCSKEE